MQQGGENRMLRASCNDEVVLQPSASLMRLCCQSAVGETDPSQFCDLHLYPGHRKSLEEMAPELCLQCHYALDPVHGYLLNLVDAYYSVPPSHGR